MHAQPKGQPTVHLGPSITPLVAAYELPVLSPSGAANTIKPDIVVLSPSKPQPSALTATGLLPPPYQPHVPEGDEQEVDRRKSGAASILRRLADIDARFVRHHMHVLT